MKILQGTVQFCIATTPFLAIALSGLETAKTKGPYRENQWFQRWAMPGLRPSTHLPKTHPSTKECPGLTDLLVTGHSLWWRSLIYKSDGQFFTLILLTHNLLRFSERKIRGFSDRYFTEKSASPAGMFRGRERDDRHLCDGARPPPKRARA